MVVSNLDVINVGNDKYLTYKFLKKNSLAYPKTFLENEMDEALSNLSFPMIIKPRNGYRSIDVFKVNTEKELRKKTLANC